MKGKRWDLLKPLYESIIERASGRRPDDVARDEEKLDASIESTATLAEGLAPGQMVANRFRIIRFVAQGGMGAVYEAEDTVLNERVALKTLRAAFTHDEHFLSRFHNEIRIAKKIADPRVCRVHDLHIHVPAKNEPGESISFLTMKFVDGETLSKRVRQRGRLSSEEAAPIAHDMAAALYAAHRQNVVHRDFKSSNVMLTRDADGRTRAVVTDFGIAQDLARVGSDAGVTAPGEIIGTPAYMAPEQLMGATVTPATDVYALGIVIFEMLTGSLPFGGGGVLGAFERLKEPAPELHTLAPDAPASWVGLVGRCLERDPAKRFSDAGEVLNALTMATPDSIPARSRRGRKATVAVLGCAFLVAILFMLYLLRPPPIPAEKQVVVLPFENVGHDPHQQVFCDGLLETSTSMLTEIELFRTSLSVTPANEVRRQNVTTVAAARRNFGATLVVSGSIQATAGDTLININVVDARSRKQLRSATVDVRPAEMAYVQQSLATRIADLLALELKPEEQRAVTARHAASSAANDAYLRGKGYLNRADLTKNLDAAISELKRSVEIDSSFADAQAALALAYRLKYGPTRDHNWLTLARQAAGQAIASAPDSPNAQAASGAVELVAQNFEAARGYFNRALQLDPVNEEAYRGLAKCDDQQGLVAQAEQRYLHAIQLRPGDWYPRSALAIFYAGHARYADAAQMLRKVLELTPDNPIVHRDLGGIDIKLGDLGSAEKELARSIEIEPTPAAYSNLGAAYIYEGKYEQAIPVLEKAAALSVGNPGRARTVWLNLGDAYAAAPGTLTKAADAYRHALETVQTLVAQNPTDPDLRSSMAAIEAKLGNKEAALTEIGHALRVAPDNPDVRYRSAVVYELSGDRSLALAALKNAIQAGYSLDQVERDPVMANLRKDARFQAIGRKR